MTGTFWRVRFHGRWRGTRCVPRHLTGAPVVGPGQDIQGPRCARPWPARINDQRPDSITDSPRKEGTRSCCVLGAFLYPQGISLNSLEIDKMPMKKSVPVDDPGAEVRFERAVMNALATPPKPHRPEHKKVDATKKTSAATLSRID